MKLPKCDLPIFTPHTYPSYRHMGKGTDFLVVAANTKKEMF